MIHERLARVPVSKFSRDFKIIRTSVISIRESQAAAQFLLQCINIVIRRDRDTFDDLYASPLSLFEFCSLSQK